MDDLRAVLRHREFRLLWGARAATSLGDRIVFIALALYVTDIGSPSDVGLVLAANALPLVLFVLIGGVWADRLERHRVMVVTDVVRAALHGLLAVLIFLGPAPIWAIVVIEAGFGTAQAFFNPAFTGLVPQTVPEDEFQQANAANTIVWNVAELVGPAIADRARARARRGLGVHRSTRSRSCSRRRCSRASARARAGSACRRARCSPTCGSAGTRSARASGCGWCSWRRRSRCCSRSRRT